MKFLDLEIFRSVEGWQISIIVILIIMLLFLKEIVIPRDYAHAASQMSLLGIIGTFLGITLGLVNFDSEDINSSIPLLLDGLKTAFLTSIVGMCGAFIIKGWGGIRNTRVNSQEPKATIETLAKLLESINIQVKNSSDQLIKEFSSFKSDVTHANIESVIDALNKVMSDFNAKITEQFGENFVHLNESVGKLVTWQENYKTHLEQSQIELQNSQKIFSSINDTFSEIMGKISSVSDASEDLRELLLSLATIRDDIENHLQSLCDVTAEAKTALPTLDYHVRQLTEEFSKNVETSTNSVNDSMKNTSEILKKGSEILLKTVGSIESLNTDVKDSVEHIRVETANNLKEICKLPLN